MKPYAGYNPYLIYHSLQVAEEQHIIGNESLAVCIQKIEQYIQHGPLLCSQIEKIAECFHFAKQNRWMDAVFYIASFVYTHRLAYIVDHNQDSVIIGMNFPLLPKLIKGYLHSKLASDKFLTTQVFKGTILKQSFSLILPWKLLL